MRRVACSRCGFNKEVNNIEELERQFVFVEAKVVGEKHERFFVLCLDCYEQFDAWIFEGLDD